MFTLLKLLLTALTLWSVSSSSSRSSSSESSSDETSDDCLDISDRNDRQICIVQEIYESIIYPQSYYIAIGEEIAPGFEENVSGRITPVGTFDDYESSIEYFYAVSNGVAILTNNQVAGSVVQDTEMIFITSYQDLVSVRVDILFTAYQGIEPRNLTQTGFFRFNSMGTKVVSYDLSILRLAEVIDPINLNEVALGDGIANICGIEAFYCQGDNDVYDDYVECVDYLTNEIPVGSWSLASKNNYVCRSLHTILVPLRSDIHCNHIGPQSTKCIDTQYKDWYNLQFPSEW